MWGRSSIIHYSVYTIPESIHVDVYGALKARDPAALADVDVPSDGPVVTVCTASKTSLIAAEKKDCRYDGASLRESG